MKEFAIGIDSGTTKTLVSYFNEETGKPKTVRLERETDSLPTPVYISKDKHQFFGEDDMPESVLLLGGTSQIPIIEARMKQASGLAYHRLQWRRKVATLLGVTLLSYGNGSQWAKADVMVLGEEGRQGLHTSHTSAKEDVNAREEGEQTVLMNVTWLRNATWWRRVKVFSKLVEHRIDVNARDNEGRTALMKAAELGEVESINKLVKRGADVNARDNYGFTALTYAAFEGQVEAIEVLVRCGADVNAKANNGIMALMVAAAVGQAKSIEALVRCGADVNAKNEEGKTALTIAQDEGHSSIVSLLKRYGASSGIGCFITTAVV